MNSNRMHSFWIGHVHSFYVLVRFLFAIADALTTAIAIVYLLSRGLTFTEMGAMWSFLFFLTTVLDFPTGNFADIYGRKLAFVIGVFAIGMGSFVFGIGTTLWVFFVAAVFVGFGTAQISGSISSWVVDEQMKAEKQDTINKIFGDGNALASVGGVLGGLFIGVFFTGPLELLYFLSAVAFTLLGIFVFFSIPENYGQREGRWISLPKKVISYFIHSLPLTVISATIVLLFACSTVFIFVYQPLAVDLGLQEENLGYLYSIHMAWSAVGAFFLGRISKRVGEATVLVLCFVVSATGFLTIALNMGLLGLIVGMAQFSFGYGGFLPVATAWMNVFIPSDIRASANSLVGTIGTGGIIVLQVVLGAFIEAHGLIAASLCAVGFAALGIAVLSILFVKKPEHVEANQ